MSAMGDIDDIKQVKYRYLRALDTKHWDEFADTLTEDVVGGYGESIGEEHHFTDRDDARRPSCATRLPAGDHHRTPRQPPRDHRRRRRGDGDWYLQDRVIAPDFNFMLIGAGFYHDRYRRTGDGWKISETGYDRTYDASMSTENLNFKVKAGRAINL